MRVGISVGSDDYNLIPVLESYRHYGILDYVELYIQPDVKLFDLMEWNKAESLIGYIHAPHGPYADFKPEYLDLAYSAYSVLKNSHGISEIVFDPGIKENKFFSTDSLMIPENMPYMTTLGDKGVMVFPEQMPKYFVFDFAHAWITATQTGRKPKELIKEFMALRPLHFHLTDVYGSKDHLPLGDGEIDLKFIKSVLLETASITIETDNLLLHRDDIIESDLLRFNLYG